MSEIRKSHLRPLVWTTIALGLVFGAVAIASAQGATPVVPTPDATQELIDRLVAILIAVLLDILGTL